MRVQQAWMKVSFILFIVGMVLFIIAAKYTHKYEKSKSEGLWKKTKIIFIVLAICATLSTLISDIIVIINIFD